jgi:hypothetical protein
VVQVGPPVALFQFLSGVELILPVVLWFWYRRVFPSGR